MDIWGIKNITDKQISFNYDKYYKNIGLTLKSQKTEEEKKQIKELSLKKLNTLLSNVDVDVNILKYNFINLILSDKSSKYLWILYSKYKDGENYIDKISDILKQENKVIRGGTNTYKMNGWMAHSLYVYQIVNNNIANNIEILNFNGNKENVEQVKELYGLYNQLSKESKFLLKIFSLIHDIGVIEDIKFHDKLGSKYVEKVLKEIDINQKKLNKANISIDIKKLIKILQELIKYHTLITSLGSESSDLYVEKEYKKLLVEIPKASYVNKEIPKILMLLAYGDVIAVDESLMDTEKYQRIKKCYNFFEQITKGEKAERNQEKVAIERICDIIGESKVQNLESKFNYILEKYNINKGQFIEDMYNVKLMRYTGPLMKTLKNTEMTIKVFYELFELIGYFDEKEELKNYTIIFVPDKHENDFVQQFKNNNFFKCIKEMKNSKKDEFTYKNINIVKGNNSEGKYLHIRVVN